MNPEALRAATPDATSGAQEPRCPFSQQPAHRFPLPRSHPMNPPPAYEDLGSEHPVRRVVQWNGREAWFVTRHADVRALLMDPRTSADAAHPAYPAQTPALSIVRRDYQVFAQMDPPHHTEERRLVGEEFSVRNVELMRPKVQALVDRLVDRIAARERQADLVEDYARPLPCEVICTLLGVPEQDHGAIQDWARQISSLGTPQQQAADMIKDFCDGYLTELVRRKAADPGDDLLSRLIVNHMKPGRITERKVVSLARLFLTAGHESTTGTLGVGLAALLYHPDQLELLRRDPSLIRNAVEEILRFTDVTHSGRLRTAREDIQIGDVTIRAGDAIIMHQPTADRDPAVFEDPHRFDITRKNARLHLAFGSGIHMCIGQPLARMELQIAIITLVQRLPGLRPLVPLEQLPFHTGLAIYGLESLPVAW
ncbi:cytochrome P450 [Ramlibacter henchirensis]|uniref:Cytochrome P450 n=1 Tax=Ramlibacter henchirensis TaxID=204072 RepID=A0A4Z0BX22_9BURK|nr:cytochrome P450 [Ramlibacter henchirensis]TFZ02808.1 cytochrome P450 [Ramlibacter henchirensis]